MVLTIIGTFAGGLVTTVAGLGHALWIFGVVQIFSNAGYLLLALLDRPNLVAMYGATGFEVFAAGLGMGAFGVLLFRLTEKRFSATQYALFSSLFAVPRVLAGPLTGFTVECSRMAIVLSADDGARNPGTGDARAIRSRLVCASPISGPAKAQGPRPTAGSFKIQPPSAASAWRPLSARSPCSFLALRRSPGCWRAAGSGPA